MSKDNFVFHVCENHSAKKVDDKFEIYDAENNFISAVRCADVKDLFISPVDTVSVGNDTKKITKTRRESLGFVDSETNEFGATTLIYQTNGKGEVVSSAMFMDDSYGSSFQLLSGNSEARDTYKQIMKTREETKWKKSYSKICAELTDKRETKAEFIYVNPAMVNPKTKENVRDAEIARLKELKAQGKTIVGLEMTVPQLAEICDKNIDPQHTDKKVTQSCVREVAKNAEDLLGQYKGKDVVFCTNRVDVDSVAAFVVANRFLAGEKVDYNPNIAEINKHDTFQGEKWSGQKPIELAFNPENKTGALASSIKVFMVTPKNIADVEKFIDTGVVDETTMNAYRQTQQKVIDMVNSGEIGVSVKNGVAHVKTTMPCATAVGYAFAPVVIAENPEMKLGPTGTPFRKLSVCQHEEGYVDLGKVKEALAGKENGWGGSPTFIGSPQGTSSEVSVEEIRGLISRNLTAEYKNTLVNPAMQKAMLGKGKE